MPNYDEKTGIHHGVISPHSVMPEALDDICFGANITDPIYEESREEVSNKINEFFKDLGFLPGDKEIDIRDEILEYHDDHYQGDDTGIYDYKDGNYTLHNSGDNFGLFVIKSPYYTFCRQCSPCAPGAGNLDEPIEKEEYEKIGDFFCNYHKTALKTYCLDKSFFEGEKAPYRVYRVEDDTEVV